MCEQSDCLRQCLCLNVLVFVRAFRLLNAGGSYILGGKLKTEKLARIFADVLFFSSENPFKFLYAYGKQTKFCFCSFLLEFRNIRYHLVAK